ncbi:hypothetical protein GCM10027569_54870 [Flindersiella endophytica]
MNANEAEIRELISRWVVAVHNGDLDGVLADHAGDIVMYDVPPPYEGVRGLAAYRETWPGFFEWQASGASFELESLDVVTGEEVAFAYALLRCGTAEDFAADPANRLRLTLGLRRSSAGRWVVVHEHHSFPSVSASDADDGGVRALLSRWSEQTRTKDLDGMMTGIAEDVVSYEMETPLQYAGIDSVREVCSRGLKATEEEVDFTVPEPRILVREDLAVEWGLDRIQAGVLAGVVWSRGTRVFQRRAGEWVMVHQHLSYPRDPSTGQARTDLEP